MALNHKINNNLQPVHKTKLPRSNSPQFKAIQYGIIPRPLSAEKPYLHRKYLSMVSIRS